jgi:sulfur carrier protein ThiS
MPAVLTATGVLKTYLGGEAQVEVPAQRTVQEILLSLQIPPEVVALVTVNGIQQPKDYLVQDGDAVKILAVMGGG